MARNEISLSMDGDTPAQCHLIPCKIGDHGCQQVRAREYFWPTIRSLDSNGDDDDEVKELKRPDNYSNDPDDPVRLASFRGRPLQGKNIKIPDGFHGFALNKADQIASSKPQVQKQFDRFSYWNWDELPSRDDAIVKAFGWINVARAIHDPIDN